jgi:two-component sensor histidine kinase
MKHRSIEGPPLPRGTGIGTLLLRALAAQLRDSFSRRSAEVGLGTVAELRFPAEPLNLLTP